eukprot:4501082-Pleurochrysis_carterae.AAC.2
MPMMMMMLAPNGGLCAVSRADSALSAVRSVVTLRSISTSACLDGTHVWPLSVRAITQEDEFLQHSHKHAQIRNQRHFPKALSKPIAHALSLTLRPPAALFVHPVKGYRKSFAAEYLNARLQ